MTTVGIGPRARIDGPRPLSRKYGLLQSANNPTSGVTLVPSANEQWESGVNVWTYPTGDATVFDALAAGTSQTPKGFGPDDLESPSFYPVGVVYADTCTTASIPDDASFKARANLVFAAVEGAALERELLFGTAVPDNLHLAGISNLPNGSNPTSPLNGLAILEDEIATSGMGGLIHLTPGLAAILRANYVISDEGDGVLRTGNGTLVIPGAGYVGSAVPESLGGGVPSGWEEWMFATGPIDLRRSEVVTLPGTQKEALDRGTGATNHRPNTITYLIERYYLYDWDDAFSAAVLVDRCQSDCGITPS